MVDWDLAVATATRLVRPGPTVSRDEAHQAVADLRELSVVAQAEVRRFTGLDASTASDGVAIIDRPGWVRVNVDGFRMLLPTARRQAARTPDQCLAVAPGLTGAVGPKITGVETGVLLAYLSSKVLGQYELFGTNGDQTPGRLLLVAPNIVHAEQEMGVDSRDFRLWVCIHEETHRTQFGAVPWLRDHLISEIQAFLGATEVDPSALARPAARCRRRRHRVATRGGGSLAARRRPDRRAARDPRPAHRGDVAARGARRLRHGRRRA